MPVTPTPKPTPFPAPSTPPTVVLTGASGFVGGRVADCLRSRLPGVRLRLVGHRGGAPVAVPGGGAEVRTVDLADPATLRGLCDGADVLVHCASRVTGPAEACHAVNADGTAALVAEAGRAGVRRVVLLSTAGVYGRGPFRAAHPRDLPIAPVSAASRSRALAERAVLAAGGTVLRPHLVYGTGDRWVGPALIRLAAARAGADAAWPARVSAIDVRDLARALAATALAPPGALTSPVYHANHPRPVRVAALIAALTEARGVEADGVGTARAGNPVAHGGGVDGRHAHDLAMVDVDHYFASDDLWHDLGLSPGPGFPSRFAAHAAWYARASTRHDKSDHLPPRTRQLSPHSKPEGE